MARGGTGLAGLVAALGIVAGAAGGARADEPAYREYAWPRGKRIVDQQVFDLDGDGRKDLMLVRGRRVSIYLQDERGRFHATDPRHQRFNFIDNAILWTFADLDGDGRTEVLFLARTDRPGLLDIVKVLITKEVPVELLFYYGRKDGGFPRQPDERRGLEIPILFSSARRGLNVGTSAVLTLLGDFDGDGRRDLLLRSSSDELAVFRGEGRRFSDDEAVTIRVQTMDGYRFLEPEAVDLNGDGRSDLVLTYYSWDQKHDRISILVSQRR